MYNFIKILLFCTLTFNFLYSQNVQKKEIKILAVRVEFQEDNDEATTGNGKFGSIYTKYKDSIKIIDPLPFDKKYFESHLNFAHNYYSYITNGLLDLKYTLLDDIITTNKKMRDYSPPVKSNDFKGLALLSAEIWDKVKTKVNLNNYDLVLIFHAGVGRDVEIPGSLGYSRDLPSVYLSLSKLNEYLNDPVLNLSNTEKFPTIICPSTDNREIETFGSKTLLELSINGLIVSSVASYIGLPDLFDTKTGLTAIGRFGLMDGQSIFTYGGTFLPEPSAWEKLKLYELLGLKYPGFYEIDLSDGKPKKVNIKVRSKYQAGDTTILKVKISDDEYYLIENRNRDANNNGAIIDIYNNSTGVAKQITFNKDQNGFQYYDIKALEGVVTNVDEFDWALPASGIAIWYIDEKVIREKINSNSINADKTNRGVFLVEADGIYNIGYTYETPLGNVIGEGDEYDLWYKGNKAKLYKNIFNNKSNPPAVTKDYLPTFLELKDFSGAGVSMSFTIQATNPILLKKEINLVGKQNKYQKIVYADGKLNIFSSKDSLFIFYNDTLKYQTTYYGKNPAITQNIIVLNDLTILDNKANYLKKINTNKVISSNVVVKGKYIYAGTNDGIIIKYDIDTQNIENINITNKSLKQIIVLDNDFYCLTGNNELYKNDQLLKVFNENITKIFYDIASNNIIAQTSNKIIVGNNSYSIPDVSVSFGDMDKSGNVSFVYRDENKVAAKKLSGAYTDKYPYDINSEGKAKRIILFDYNKDGYADFITSSNNRIFLVNGKELKTSNYPAIPVGDTIYDFYLTKNSNLIVLKNNYIKIYEITDIDDYEVISYGYDVSYDNNAIIVQKNLQKQINEYFPKNLCYNWPNPVYDGITYIRYFVTEDSEINIRIVNLAGDIVKKVVTSATANIENEILVDVSNLGTGVYYGSIEAKSKTSGKKSTNIIKIAIVK